MPSSALVAFLQIPGLVRDQYTIRITEALHDQRAYVVADGVGVPHRSIQQPLHRVWAGMAGMFRELPTRLHLKIGQQAGHEPCRRATRLDPGEPARERVEYLVQHMPPLGNVYAVTSGHRKT